MRKGGASQSDAPAESPLLRVALSANDDRVQFLSEPDSQLGSAMRGPPRSAHHEADRGDEDPGFGARDGSLEVLGKSAAAAEPSESTLDDPSPAQHLEPLGGVRSLDDFDGPTADPRQCFAQFLSGIPTVGEQMAQPGIEPSNGSTPTALSRSWMSAVSTVSPTRCPSASVMMWRLRPLTFLPAS